MITISGHEAQRKLKTAFVYSAIPFLLLLGFVNSLSGSTRIHPSAVHLEPQQMIENSVVIPAYHEAPNVRPLVERVFRSLDTEQFSKTEIVIVDDNSKDGTIEACETLKQEGYNVVLIVRQDESGLSSAVLRGFKESRGDKLYVMDADLQHPPEAVPRLIAALSKPSTSFVLGTRYGKGVEMDKDWPVYRRVISWGARILARPLTTASDPMTGFFGLKKSLYLQADPINPSGFKIALELLLKSHVKTNEIVEVPFSFSKRLVGESKLSSKVIVKYVGQLLTLYLWRYTISFVFAFEFGLVGILWLALVLADEGLVAWKSHRITTLQRERKRRDDV